MQKNKAEVGQIFLFLLGLFIWFLLAESILNSGLATHGKWLMKLQGPVGIIVRWVWIVTLSLLPHLCLSLRSSTSSLSCRQDEAEPTHHYY